MVDEELLKTVIASSLNIDRSIIDPNSGMENLTVWDSLHHINLVLALEEEFHVSFSDDDVAKITSYSLIKKALEDLLKLKTG
jgi:acyl carrier protein